MEDDDDDTYITDEFTTVMILELEQETAFLIQLKEQIFGRFPRWGDDPYILASGSFPDASQAKQGCVRALRESAEYFASMADRLEKVYEQQTHV